MRENGLDSGQIVPMLHSLLEGQAGMRAESAA